MKKSILRYSQSILFFTILVTFDPLLAQAELAQAELAQTESKGPLSKHEIIALLTNEHRWKEDALRDKDRRPDKIIEFMGLAPGDKVLDIYTGGGWYTELFSMGVGINGVVYAHNDELTWRFGSKELIERTDENRLDNVIRLDEQPLTDLKLAEDSVDIAFMGINYHDLFFTRRIRNGKLETMRESPVDHKKALTVIKNILKDDGTLIISDHFAHPGSGYDAANDLHRIDPDIVKYQLEAAGFNLLEEAFYLRNQNDDLSKLVFDPSIRGKTDRFIYKFGKK